MRRIALSLALLLCLSLAPHAHAAVLIALKLSELVEQSDYVVVARAQEQSARFSRGLIVTDTSLRVISSLKGSTQAGATLIATTLGGSIDDLALSVPGAARFPVGESAIVFLRRAPGRADLHVTGMSQGVMPIVGEGTTARVQSGGDGAALMERDGDGKLIEAPAQRPERAMNGLLDEIQRLVRGE